jgi:hypothetical protein
MSIIVCCVTYKCGRCHINKQLNEQERSYFDYNNFYMVCADCNRELAPYAAPSYPVMSCRVSDTILIDVANTTVQWIERPVPPKRDENYYKIATKRAKCLADKLGIHYIDGMSTRDLWHRMLAKRVITKFRALVAKRTIEKVAFVLSHCTDMNHDTAISIASTHIH